MRPPSEPFIHSAALKLANALAKPPLKLSLSYYRPTTFLLYRINKLRMEEIGATIPKYQPLGFYGTLCATTDDKPSPPAQFAHLLES